jgi:hypothetical protein
MWYTVELSLSSYLVDELEIGMLFVNRISVGVIEPYIELFELEEIPEDQEAFLSKNGCPVELVIINANEQVIATHSEIGWWDEGESVDEYRDITLEDINYILRENDGEVDIEIDEHGDIILYDDKVVLSLVDEYYDEDWDQASFDELEEY